MKNMKPKPDISVVVPVFNSAQILPEVFAGVRDVMETMNLEFEAIFVDDGSSDESWDTILALQAAHGGLVRGFRLARNSGQQAATYCGLLQSRGDWVVTLDDDLQTHPREIKKLWTHALESQADVVYGAYDSLRHPLLHRLGSRIFHVLLRRVAPAFPRGSSFRLIRAEVLQTLSRNPGPWIIVDALLAWQSSDMSTVLVEHNDRKSGRSGYSFARLCGIAWTLLITYSKLPLRLMGGFGFLSAFFSIGLGLYYLVRKFTVGAQVGFSALIVTITFSSGVILLSLGILGEYISQIHTMVSGQPAFSIKAKTE